MPEELPCLQCGKPTALRWSIDMDLPSLPFCCQNCATMWFILAANKIAEEKQGETDE